MYNFVPNLKVKGKNYIIKMLTIMCVYACVRAFTCEYCIQYSCSTATDSAG